MSSVYSSIPAIPFAPPIYCCRRAVKPFVLDGILNKPFWENAAYTDLFTDIEGSHMPAPRFNTKAKILWDDENLYIGAILEGNEIWGTIKERDDIIFTDNDFEIFIDPDSDTQQYYEFEMNVLNTLWDLFLPVAYRDNGSALTGYDIHGLKTAVHVDGIINGNPKNNNSWSVEIVIPFASITECLPQKNVPKEGDYYRINFSRVQWKTNYQEGDYKKQLNPLTDFPLPEDNWVWSPTGVINIHYPELWGFIFFTSEKEGPSSCSIPEEEYRKWELRKLYYAQRIYKSLYGHYSNSLDRLTVILKNYSPCPANQTIRPLSYQIETTSHTFELSCPTGDGKGVIVLYSTGKVEIL